MEKFRMPLAPLKRKFYWSLAACGVGFVTAGVFKLIGAPSGLIFFVSLIFTIALTGSYFSAKHRVWVEVGAEGVRGRGLLGLKNTLRWEVPVGITPSFSRFASGGVKGLSVSKLDKIGIPIGFGGVFIPEAILCSVEFQHCLLKFAPIEHPLYPRRKSA